MRARRSSGPPAVRPLKLGVSFMYEGTNYRRGEAPLCLSVTLFIAVSMGYAVVPIGLLDLVLREMMAIST